MPYDIKRSRLDTLLYSRRAAIGSALSALLCTTISSPVSAQVREAAPNFRSGRLPFTMLRPQRPLPAIRLQRLDGTILDLSSLRGKPVLLNFWATWCAACRTELPILDQLYAAYRTRGLQVLAISEDRGDRAQVGQFVRRLGIRSLPIFVDPGGDVAYSDTDNKRSAPFALYGMPITYLATRSGKIVGYVAGAADWSAHEATELLDYLDQS